MHLWAIPRDRVFREGGIVLLFLSLAVLATWPLAADMAGSTLLGQDTLSHLWTVNWVTRHAFEPSWIFGGNISKDCRQARSSRFRSTNRSRWSGRHGTVGQSSTVSAHSSPRGPRCSSW
jgi:hypothetical protein